MLSFLLTLTLQWEREVLEQLGGDIVHVIANLQVLSSCALLLLVLCWHQLQGTGILGRTVQLQQMTQQPPSEEDHLLGSTVLLGGSLSSAGYKCLPSHPCLPEQKPYNSEFSNPSVA